MREPKILVVDDEPAMLRSVERLLAPHYPLATAGSAREALAVLPDFGPDLAIVDIRMPERNGFELLTELRKTHPDVDVIFMTGAVHELDAQIIRSIRERAFYFIQKPFDREVLLTLVERCLELRRLAAENRRYVKQLERELDEARSFQLGLLAPASARLAGASIHASYDACTALGGDFYDYVEADGGRGAFIIADVSGHGVSAAMLTAIVKSAFHEAHADDYEPRAVVRRTARALRPFDDDRFVTLFCARFDSGTLDYVNAGHPPVLHWSATRHRTQIERTGPLVSPAFGDIGWDVGRIELALGDQLLAYTDGITEARGEGGLFGEERLFEVVDSSKRSGGGLLKEIHAALKRFSAGRPADDDRTLLTLEVEGS